ncbi:MAG: hypothetical protein Aurels2KO_55630 [Aureliella sp.]
MRCVYRPSRLARLAVIPLLILNTIAPALAENPTGGVVVGGAANIATAGSTLNVNAASDRAIINWQSFNIGAGNTANFNLPSASSAILNRVTTAGAPSSINGSLNSNGNVFLVNPSGIVVGPSGAINTNGFTASTFDVSNRAFMNGGAMSFRGDSTASIVNQGTINTGTGGAHFMANQVVNSGAINSQGGSITIGSGHVVNYDNGVTRVEANMATLQNGYSETASLINNSGVVRATGAVISGGEVYLTNPGGRVLNSGTIQASNVAVSSRQFNTVGSVDVSGANGGTVSVEASETLVQGEIDASGLDQGGRVEITGDSISQFATIDASSTGGIGGDVRLSSSKDYTATSAGNIDVSGTSGGSIAIGGPGRIVTSSDISALGTDGDGGTIDIASSTKTSLLSASVDASGTESGGRIRIGGELRGGRDLVVDELANSRQTLISPGTELIARGGTGDGGNAIVWSDERTQYYGAIDVSAAGSKGGFVELSSAGLLEYQGLESIKAGGGTVLLDPKNGIIMDVAPSGMNLITFSLTGTGETFLDAFDRFGTSVGLNAAGDRLAVGAIGDDGGLVAKPSSGAVYLFDLDLSDVTAAPSLEQILRDGSALASGQTLELEAFDRFGSAVDFDGPGGILAVGAENDDFVGFDPAAGPSVLEDTGAVYLFELSTTSLSESPNLPIVIRDGTPLVGGGNFDLLANETSSVNPQLGGDNFGTGVAVDEDGNRLVVGAQGVFESFVYLFEINPTNLAAAPNLAQRLGSDTLPGLGDLDAAAFGASVSINSAGDILAVGAPELNNRDGGVYLFNLISQNYAQPAQFRQLIENSPGGAISFGTAEFGSGVALNGVGDLLGVGAEDLGFLRGGVFGFQLDTNDLTIAPNLIIEVRDGITVGGFPVEIGLESYGADIAVNAAGNRVAVGAPGFDGDNRIAQDSGSVSLFDVDLSPTDFSFVGSRVSTNAISTTMPDVDDLGLAVELGFDNTQLAVSSRGPEFGDEFGQVHFFLLDGDDLNVSPTLVTTLQDGRAINTPVGTEFLRLDDQDMFGSSLAIADGGNLLAIGAAGDDGAFNADLNSGAVYLFETDPNDPVLPFTLPQVIRNNQALRGGSLALGDNSGFGGAIELTEDGSRLVAGADGDEKVFLFDFEFGFAGAATLAQTIEDGTVLADGNTFQTPFFSIGSGVSVNADGSRLAVSQRNGSGGSVFLFDLDPTDWSLAPSLAQELSRGVTLADGNTLNLIPGGDFGGDVSFNASGNRLAVGQENDFDLNAIFLFELDANDLSAAADLQQTIQNGTPLASGGEFQGARRSFGSSVSLDGSGDRLAAGNPEINRFHLFDFGGGSFEQTVNLATTISNDSPLGGDVGLPASSGFGGAVALNAAEDRLAVEAARAVYLFDVDTSLGADPSLAQVIRSGSGLANGRILDVDLSDSDFGNDLAFNGSGNILAIGDPEDRGAVYLFSLDNNDLSASPSLEQFLTDSPSGPLGLDLSFSDRFGFSVDLNLAGDRLAVGAIGDQGIDNMSGFQTGAAYLFDLNTNDLSETPVLRALIQDGALTGTGIRNRPFPVDPLVVDLDAGDRFGYAVALTDDGSFLLVGAPGDDGNFNLFIDQGTVYGFSVPPVNLPSINTFDQIFSVVQNPVLAGSGFDVEAGDEFGTSVSFAGPGIISTGGGIDVFGQTNSHALAVGAPGDDGATNNQQDTGAIWLFAADTTDPEITSGEGSLEGGSPLNFFDVLRFPELDGIGEAVDLSRNGQLLAIGAESDSLSSGGVSGIRAGIGSVTLVGFGGANSTTLSGDLLFSDLPADTTVIDPDDILAILNAGDDLVLQFSNDLEIRSDIITNMTGVGTFTVQTGRSINVLPGTSINVGDGSLDFEFNSESALASQIDPGDPRLLLNNVSIVATGDSSRLKFSGAEVNDFLDVDPLIEVSGSTISAQEVEFGSPQFFAADHRIVIDAGTSISGDQVTIRGTNSQSGIAIEIAGAGTEVTATDRMIVGGVGGLNLLDGAVLKGVGEGSIGVGIIQLGNEPEFEPFVRFGDSLTIDNASIVTENGDVTFELTSVDVITGGRDPVFIDDGPKFERNSLSMTQSEVVAGGMGRIILAQFGDDSYRIDLSGSTIRGQDVLIASNVFAFSTEAGFSTIELKNESQINTAADGELRIFLPQQNSFMIDATSSLNGVTGNNVFDGTGNLRNNQGIGEFVGETPALPLDIEYLGTEDANFALYISTIDLTPGLFFTANDGQSTYGQNPDDPGLSITRGMLQDEDTLESIGVGTDFDLTRFSDAGTYTINVVADDLDPKYRLLGTESGTFTILPADLVFTLNSYSKTYGETFVFPENDFKVDGLVNGEMIGPVQLLSLGRFADASVQDSPYIVSLNVSGAGSFSPLNYNITSNPSFLTVNPAPLLINPLAQSKTYGDAMLDRSRFTAQGLRNGEVVTSVGFSSNGGIAATANVGMYDLTAADPVVGTNGFVSTNYAIEFGTLEGGLTVIPANLSITALDQVKLEGDTFMFSGTEFQAVGLRDGDTVTSAQLASDGTPAAAALGDYNIAIADPAGSFDPANYNVILIDGNLRVVDEIILPALPDNLTYDRFGRYQQYFGTIGSLPETSTGRINVIPVAESNVLGDSQEQTNEEPRQD